MARRLITLYYPCPGCDRILDAGGLAADVWVRCPACDRPHPPPSHLDEVARPKRRASSSSLSSSSLSSTQPSSETLTQAQSQVQASTRPAPDLDPKQNGDARNGTAAAARLAPESPKPSEPESAPPPRRSLADRTRYEDWDSDDEPLDPIAAFELRRNRERRLKNSENTLLRRVFGLSLFMIVSAWTIWSSVYYWADMDPVRLIICGCAIVFSLFIAFADLLKRDRD